MTEKAANKRKLKPKHVPVRTCVSCRQTGAKRQLVRIVRTPGGQIQIDESGKVSGRGAYLCRSRACWNAAVKSKSLERGLKAAFDQETKLGLEQFGAALPE